MQFFQNSGIYRSYRPKLRFLERGVATFAEALQVFFADRYGVAHILHPVLTGDPSAFFTNGDNEFAQRLWAKEQGLADGMPLDAILLSQIEHHRTEVFYNSDPMRYGDAFLKRLPGSIKRTIAWRAAPSQGGEFLTHDIIVNNFPSLLEGYRAQGVRAEYFTPAHDPEMNAYAMQTERPIDVLFVGTYSRYHRGRAHVLEAIAALRHEMNVVMHLDRSRMTRLAETPLGWVGPLAKHRRNADIRSVACPPVFGRNLLTAIGNAKIVINGAIDMGGSDRGNMRVWEALGCGAALVSDVGQYPNGMVSPDHFLTYASAEEAVSKVRDLHASGSWQAIAKSGHAMIANDFSKSLQWKRFLEIAS